MHLQTTITRPIRTLIGVLACVASPVAFADSAADWEKMKAIDPNGYVCNFATHPIKIDGKLDEEDWKSAPWTSEFIDIEGTEKPKPRFRTRAKMLWNEEYFFVAAMLEDPHVWGTLTQHDAVIFYDNDFEVFIDPNGDNHEYYELELNALNTTWDLFLPKPYKDGGKADNSWEIPGLKTAVDIRGTLNDPTDQDDGWSIEIAIPWAVMKQFAHRPAPPNNGDQWRVNFSRVQWKHQVVEDRYQKVPETREDNWVWSPQGIIDMHRPERWGYVQFSGRDGNPSSFAPDPAAAARDRLMEVYHRQKSFQRQQNRWASELSELKLPVSDPDAPESINLRLTETGYIASLRVPNPPGAPQTWWVRQDSKLWSDTDHGQNQDRSQRERDGTDDSRASQNETDAAPEEDATTGPAAGPSKPLSKAAVQQLKDYLATPSDQRSPLQQQGFASTPLTQEDLLTAKRMLWKDHADRLRRKQADAMKSKQIKIGELTMPFAYQVFGEKPDAGRSLFLSMHGGGGAPKRVNDQQWENQKRLYRPDEGVYLAPRAPTDTWNLWHQEHIDQFFARLIENLIVFEDVDPNRVYLMGYSAGGDGVYQLAPRMADQLAAASMMAGHPNETSPLGLRNLPFAIHMGELDSAYNRNQLARQWADQLATLHKADPDGYRHEVVLHQGKGHWMDRQDAVAVDWMSSFERNPHPRRIVWKQDDVVHQRFYWLAIDPQTMRDRAEVRAQIDGQVITVLSDDVDQLTIRLSDELVEMDRPVTIRTEDRQLFSSTVSRTIKVVAKTLAERGDPAMLFSCEIPVDLKASE